MTEIKSPIPSRIYNAATNGHVCGADDVDFGSKVVHLVKYDRSGNEVSFESQVTQANKIYVIHDDFVLSSNVTIPSNCVLEFDGGSILGQYTLTGNYTMIGGSLKGIFGNVTIAGTWNVSEIYSYMFKDLSGNNAILNLFNLQNEDIQNNIYIEEGRYPIKESFDNWSGIIKLTSNTSLYLNGEIYLITNNLLVTLMISIYQKNNVTIKGSGKITGDIETNTRTEEGAGYGLAIASSNNVTIEGLEICKCYTDSVYVFGSNNNNISIVGCKLHDSNRQGISIIQGNRINIIGNEIYNITGKLPKSAIDLEPNETTQLIRNVVVSNNIIHDCYTGIQGYDTIENITIVNNRILDCYFSIKLARNLFSEGSYRYGNVVLQNNHIKCKTLNIEYVDKISIINNNILVDSSATENYYTLYLAHVNEAVVDNCIIDLDSKGIIAIGSEVDNLKVCNCRIKCSQDNFRGIDTSYNDNAILVFDNNIIECCLKSVDNITITNNIFKTNCISIDKPVVFIDNRQYTNFLANITNNILYLTSITTVTEQIYPIYVNTKNSNINYNKIHITEGIWQGFIQSPQSTTQLSRNIYNGTIQS